jgi:SAM-dependent methyltransferase
MDEWGDIVPLYTRVRPLDAASLWRPRFEHRVLLSRLILRGLGRHGLRFSRRRNLQRAAASRISGAVFQCSPGEGMLPSMSNPTRWAPLATDYETTVFSPTVPTERRRMFLRLARGPRVLNLGTGPLPHLNQDLVRAGHRVIATDWSEKMLAVAAVRFAHSDLQYVLADHRALPFPPDTFDTVLAVNSMLPDDPREVPQMLREAHRVLSPGGRFVGFFPAWESWLQGQRVFRVPLALDHEGMRVLGTIGWQYFPSREALFGHFAGGGWSPFSVRTVFLRSLEEVQLLHSIYGIDTTRCPMFEYLALAAKSHASL